MNRSFRQRASPGVAALAAAAALLVAGPARADIDPHFTFGFTDLDGDYTASGAGGQFRAVASALASGGPFDSAGDVTRVAPPQSTADFDPGFAAMAGSLNVELTMDISNVTSDSAEASGSFTITDLNGDTITGEIAGAWNRLGSVFASFKGLLQNVALTNSSGDDRFDGSFGSGFSMLFSGQPLAGAIIVLETGAWFDASFADQNTQVEASIIPAPSAAALGLIGLVMLARRRAG